MPWFLHPTVYQQLPVYLNPELYLFVLMLLLTAAFAITMRRRGARGLNLVSSTWFFFFGLFLTVMLSMHNAVILGLRLFEREPGSTFVFDFHLYALLLLGSVLTTQGIKLMLAARLASIGNTRGRKSALRTTLIVLAIAVPLIPIQFFGMVLTIGSMITIAAVAIAGRPRPTVDRAAEGLSNPVIA